MSKGFTALGLIIGLFVLGLATSVFVGPAFLEMEREQQWDKARARQLPADELVQNQAQIARCAAEGCVGAIAKLYDGSIARVKKCQGYCGRDLPPQKMTVEDAAVFDWIALESDGKKWEEAVVQYARMHFLPKKP